MKMTLLAAVAAIALAGPAMATCGGGCDTASGGFGGLAFSNSVTSGVAATGGIAAFGMSGYSMVENGQFAANTSGAEGRLTFTEIDRHARNRDVDGIKVDLDLDTFSLGSQGSFTRTVDRGVGTVGFGAGFGASDGGGHAAGSFGARGFESW